MFFDELLKESSEEVERNDIDAVINADPSTEEGIEKIAQEVEDAMATTALESVSYFEGGEEALNKFLNEAANVEALTEARKMAKRTIVRLSKDDDLKKREHIAALIACRNAKDPLFDKLARNRVMERKLRAQIFKKYGMVSKKAARISQRKHIKAMKSMPALPAIK